VVHRDQPRPARRLHAADRHDCHRCGLRHCDRRRYARHRDRPRHHAAEVRSALLPVSVPLPYPPPFHLNRKIQSQQIFQRFYFIRNSISKWPQPDQFKTSSRERCAPAQLAASAQPMALQEEP
jgi:hypothetical protein